MTTYACQKGHLHWFTAYYLIKVSCEISVLSLKDFLNTGKKVKKMHKLCIIMLTNPSEYNFLRKNYFLSSNNYR